MISLLYSKMFFSFGYSLSIGQILRVSINDIFKLSFDFDFLESFQKNISIKFSREFTNLILTLFNENFKFWIFKPCLKISPSFLILTSPILNELLLWGKYKSLKNLKFNETIKKHERCSYRRGHWNYKIRFIFEN